MKTSVPLLSVLVAATTLVAVEALQDASAHLRVHASVKDAEWTDNGATYGGDADIAAADDVAEAAVPALAATKGAFSEFGKYTTLIAFQDVQPPRCFYLVSGDFYASIGQANRKKIKWSCACKHSPQRDYTGFTRLPTDSQEWALGRWTFYTNDLAKVKSDAADAKKLECRFVFDTLSFALGTSLEKRCQ